MESKTELEYGKVFPEGYKPRLDFFETEEGIKLVKDTFEKKLSENLNLLRVSAPRFLVTGTGLQDDLAGTQKAVSFKTRFIDSEIEIVHSLAKWKRYTLGKHSFEHGYGIYTDMDAIRKDEDVDEIHSIYVDQWDWERVIRKEERTIGFLKDIVSSIYLAIKDTKKTVTDRYPMLDARLPERIQFVHSEDLEREYPHLSSKEREDKIAERYGAVFLIGIGHPLESGKLHDLRAADYDDWCTMTSDGKKGLNGDIIVWDSIRKKSLELSSMGIRVDRESMIAQLEMTGLSHRKKLEFHKGIIEESIPLTIGGGIGQSRLCMFMLEKAHIGEVQSSIWPEYVIKEFERKGIPLL